MSCIFLMSNLLITSQNIQFSFSTRNITCKQDISYITVKILNTQTNIYLTKDTNQDVKINLPTINPSNITQAILTTVTTTGSTSQLITAISYQFLSVENCITFTDYKVSPQEGITAYFYDQNLCDFDVKILQINTTFTLQNYSTILDSKSFSDLEQGDLSNFQCNSSKYIPHNAIGKSQKVAFHCCYQNFTCNQFQKTMLTLNRNVARMSIFMQITTVDGSKFTVSVLYDKVFINGLTKVKIISKQFIIDDTYFIADYSFSETIGDLKNYVVTATFNYTTLQLTYFEGLNYFSLECGLFKDVKHYYHCMNNLTVVKQILKNNPDYQFSVTIFFKNEKNQLISRHSSFETIDEISHTIVQQYWYDNGFLYLQFAKSVGYDFKGIIIIEGMENQSVLFEAEKQFKYSYYCRKLRKMERKQLQISVLIAIQEPGITVKTLYLIPYLVKARFNYVLFVYVPVNVAGVLLSCFFLGQGRSEEHIGVY